MTRKSKSPAAAKPRRIPFPDEGGKASGDPAAGENTAAVVVVPLDLWTDILERLQQMSIAECGKIYNRCAQIAPQRVPVKPG